MTNLLRENELDMSNALITIVEYWYEFWLNLYSISDSNEAFCFFILEHNICYWTGKSLSCFAQRMAFCSTSTFYKRSNRFTEAVIHFGDTSIFTQISPSIFDDLRTIRNKYGSSIHSQIIGWLRHEIKDSKLSISRRTIKQVANFIWHLEQVEWTVLDESSVYTPIEIDQFICIMIEKEFQSLNT